MGYTTRYGQVRSLRRLLTKILIYHERIKDEYPEQATLVFTSINWIIRALESFQSNRIRQVEIRELALTLYKQGSPLKVISRQTGIRRNTIYVWLKKYRIKPNRNKRHKGYTRLPRKQNNASTGF